MAYVLRYVDESGEVFERFIKLEIIHGHTAEYLFSTIKAMFDKVGLDVKPVWVSFMTTLLICPLNILDSRPALKSYLL